ncbi:MAG TPA: hypothetical protein VF796_15655 [Humisphaera sp.]
MPRRPLAILSALSLVLGLAPGCAHRAGDAADPETARRNAHGRAYAAPDADPAVTMRLSLVINGASRAAGGDGPADRPTPVVITVDGVEVFAGAARGGVADPLRLAVVLPPRVSGVAVTIDGRAACSFPVDGTSKTWVRVQHWARPFGADTRPPRDAGPSSSYAIYSYDALDF